MILRAAILACAVVIGSCTIDDVELRRTTADAAMPPDAAIDAVPDAPLGRCVCLRTCTDDLPCRDIAAGQCNLADQVCIDDAPDECVTSATCGTDQCVREGAPAEPCG